MKPIKTKPTRRGLASFNYFASCRDTSRLEPIQASEDGYSAAECFHVLETYGQELPCREPDLLARALNGKMQHGITVEMVAEDYVGRLVFASEIRGQYPDWVVNEIFKQARKVALNTLGWVPTFVSTGHDFTTLEN